MVDDFVIGRDTMTDQELATIGMGCRFPVYGLVRLRFIKEGVPVPKPFPG